VSRGAAETVAGALRRGARGASTGRCTRSSRRLRAQLDPLERGAGGVAAPRGAHNTPTGLAQVYVQGRPFFPSSHGGAGGGAGGGGGAARPARFPCVYHRAPRFEGLEGLRVLRGLLKTSRVMSRECAAIGRAAAGRAPQDAGRGPGAGSATRMFVASYAWYGEELRDAVGSGRIGGWQLAASAAEEGVRLFVAPSKAVPWDVVLRGPAGASQVLVRRGLVARVSLFLALERYAGGGAAGWRSPMPMTLHAAGQSGRADWQGELVAMLLAAGGAWRMEAADEEAGARGAVRECATQEELLAALRHPAGHAQAGQPRSCVVQRAVPACRGLAGGRRCVAVLPVLAAGALNVYAHKEALLYAEEGGGRLAADARTLAALAEEGGCGGAAAGWTAQMHTAVAEVFAALRGQGGQLLPMPRCFQLLAFHFALGPAALGAPGVDERGASAGPGGARAWLLRVEPAMELHDPFPGHRAATFGLATAALRVALRHIGAPGAGAGEGAECFVRVLAEPWDGSSQAGRSEEPCE